MDSRSVGKVIGNALSRARESAPNPCPDDNTMAAYLDGLLSPGERLAFEEHTSRCGTCRQVLGLALEVESVDSAAGPKHEPGSARPALWWLRSPVAAVAAATCMVVVGAVLVRVATGPRGDAAAPQVSALRDRAEKTRADAAEPRQETPQAAARKGQAAEPPLAPRARPAAVGRAAPLGSRAERRPPEEPRAPAYADSSVSVEATPQREGVAVGSVTTARSEAKAESAAAPKPAEGEMAGETFQSKAVRAAAEERRRADRTTFMDAAMSPAQAVRTLTEQGPNGFHARKVDGLLFYRVGDYWVDGRCAGHAEAQTVEIAAGSAPFQEVVSEFPGLPALTRDGARVVLCRNRSILVLPRGN